MGSICLLYAFLDYTIKPFCCVAPKTFRQFHDLIYIFLPEIDIKRLWNINSPGKVNPSVDIRVTWFNIIVAKAINFDPDRFRSSA